MSFVLLLVYWWEHGVPVIQYMWAIDDYFFLLFSYRQLGNLSGFETAGHWELYPNFNVIGSRAFCLDFGQSVVGTFSWIFWRLSIIRRLEI